MAAPAEVSARNGLLARLSPEDFSRLEPQLERVPLPVGTRLIEPDTPIDGYSDEAGRGYRSEAGRCSDVKPATILI
jgi:hypothetical protein